MLNLWGALDFTAMLQKVSALIMRYYDSALCGMFNGQRNSCLNWSEKKIAMRCREKVNAAGTGTVPNRLTVILTLTLAPTLQSFKKDTMMSSLACRLSHSADYISYPTDAQMRELSASSDARKQEEHADESVCISVVSVYPYISVLKA